MRSCTNQVTPSFTAAYRGRKNGKDEEDFHKLVAPNYLADFMLPGHESLQAVDDDGISFFQSTANKHAIPVHVQHLEFPPL